MRKVKFNKRKKKSSCMNTINKKGIKIKRDNKAKNLF